MDWKQLLKELADAGLTQTKIAERCGVAQSTVSDVARGAIKQPSFAFGSALVGLHAEVRGQGERAEGVTTGAA